MLKIVLVLILAIMIFFTKSPPTPEYNAYIKKYGTDTRFYCYAGYLVEENIMPWQHSFNINIKLQPDGMFNYKNVECIK